MGGQWTDLGLPCDTACSFDAFPATSLLVLVSFAGCCFLCDETERLLRLLSGVESLLLRFSGDRDREVE